MLGVFFNAFMATSTSIFFLKKLTNKTMDLKNYRVYAGMIFMILGLVSSFLLVDKLLNTLVVIAIVIVTAMIIFDLDFKNALILSIMEELLYIFCEVFVVILVLLVTHIQNKQQLLETFSGTIWINVVINISVCIFVSLPFIKKIYYHLNKLVSKQSIYNLVLNGLLILSMASLVFNLIYCKNNLIVLSLVGVSVLIFYLIFTAKGIIVHNNYLSMYIKYNDTLETLKSYEDILDKYKLSNHENKNQLLTIRNMIKNDNTVTEFIDNLVDNKYIDDNNLMLKTSKIPSGGLRALIYSKVLYMKNNNIEFVINIDKQISTANFMMLKDNLILDICKIIGVFLDNAIEEIVRINSGSISIDLFMLDECFNISISNTFEGTIDLEKIDTVKYTNKGKGHGYGLTLVKEIIDNNNNLFNTRSVNDNVFTQTLKIKLPKKANSNIKTQKSA